jgi:DNA helicase-2/ATP-dependent DNA helicase PcrA
MLSRASMMLNGKCEQVSGGTFHSFAHQIIRKFAQEIGFESNFSVLDQSDMEDALNIIRTQITKELGKKRFPQKHTLASMYSLSVNKCLPIQEILRSSYPQFIDETDKIQELFRAYIAYKRKQNMLDYDDLLVYLLTLLEKVVHYKCYSITLLQRK